jgi:Fatty acid hydroxylase superfamily
MVSLTTFNPACYLPTAISKQLPSAIACPPPPSYFSSAYNAVTTPFTSSFSTIRGMLETLVGLPFLSLLLIPTTGSWSTTLNFFFFYITWSTLILSHPPLRVEFISTLVVRLVFYVSPSLFFIAFDSLLPSAALSFKSKDLGSNALPLLRASRSRTLRYFRILGFSLLNVLLATTVQVLIEILLTRVLGVRSALRVVTSPPSPFSVLKHLVFGYLLRDVFTYTIHRYVLHESDSRVASLHESWYHSLPATFPLSASYDHPLPYLLHKFLPAYLPAILLRFHLLTYMIYLTLISLEETWTYSGYSTVPTNFILGGIARRTDNHLLEDGEGNFGSLGLVDWMMGTSVGGDIVEDVGAEAESRDVQGRLERKSRKGIEGARKGVNELRKSQAKGRKGGNRSDS